MLTLHLESYAIQAHINVFRPSLSSCLSSLTSFFAFFINSQFRIICGPLDFFNNQKLLKKEKNKLTLNLTLTHLPYRSHSIVDHVQFGRPHTILVTVISYGET